MFFAERYVIATNFITVQSFHYRQQKWEWWDLVSKIIFKLQYLSFFLNCEIRLNRLRNKTQEKRRCRAFLPLTYHCAHMTMKQQLVHKCIIYTGSSCKLYRNVCTSTAKTNNNLHAVDMFTIYLMFYLVFQYFSVFREFNHFPIKINPQK